MVKWSRVRLVLSIISAEGLWSTWVERIQFALPFDSKEAARLPSPMDQLPAVPDFYDLAGAVHVHSTHSDGTGTVAEIASAAARAGLDFVLITDHNAMTAQSLGEDRWYENGRVLIAVGTEFATEQGFLLALNVPSSFAPFRGTASEGMKEIADRGGYGFIALPCDLKDHWKDIDTRAPGIGIEVFNLSAIARTKINVPGLVLTILRYFGRQPMSAFSFVAARPTTELKLWDDALQSAATRNESMPLAIGSLDAHAIMRLGKLRYPYPTYEQVFRTLRTHVLTEQPLSGKQELRAADQRILHQGLRNGHTYMSYDNYADPTGFQFSVQCGAESIATMGETCEVASDELGKAALRICVPRSRSVIKLFRDGRIVAKTRGGLLEYPIAKDGTYRVEVYTYRRRIGFICFGSQPWIFSNPIRVRIPVAATSDNESPDIKAAFKTRTS